MTNETRAEAPYTGEDLLHDLGLDVVRPPETLEKLRVTPELAAALLNEALHWREMPAVVDTGHHLLTEETRGLAGLVVIGAPPGTGKSTLCSCWAADALKAGRAVLYLACEEPRVAVFERVAKALSASRFDDLMRGELSFYLTDVKTQFGLDDPEGFAALCANLPMQEGKGAVVVVDSLHVASTVFPTGDATTRVSRIMDALRAGANVRQVDALIATAHVNREAIKGARPSMQALRDSSTIEHAADQILIAFPALREGNKPVTPRELLQAARTSSGSGTDSLRKALDALPPVPPYYPDSVRAQSPGDYFAVRLWLKKNRFFGSRSGEYDFLLSGVRCHVLPVPAGLIGGRGPFYFGEKALDE
jgi:archaellum biogenesis ATPase FlaH